jgi:hypothetical protein
MERPFKQERDALACIFKSTRSFRVHRNGKNSKLGRGSGFCFSIVVVEIF